MSSAGKTATTGATGPCWRLGTRGGRHMASRHAEQPDKLFAAANLAPGLLLAANEDFLLAIALLTHKLIERHF